MLNITVLLMFIVSVAAAYNLGKFEGENGRIDK